MIVEIIPAGGIGRSRPLILAACQVLIRQNNGTPIAVAAEYGADGSQALAKVGDEDFNLVLRNLGVFETVICDRIELPPPPPGARLVADPLQRNRS